VLAAAKITRDAQRLPVAVDHDYRVRAILVTLPAVILDGLAGPVLAGRRH
jgi:hypothetical protein